MARPKLPRPGQILATKKLSFNGPARTRFAPSPTGSLHLGSLRTAVYNYLLARNTGGQFILRLEDTDRKRLVPGAEQELYTTLKEVGIQWDEGPIRQSERRELYQQYANKLLESGHAYRCYCSRDRLDNLTTSARQLVPPSTASYDRKCLHDPEPTDEHIVRFKAPDLYPPFIDGLHGQTSIQIQRHPIDVRFDDFTLLKSDGMPTYHFANVVDDHLMGITHVVRGEEWLPSTPKHLALYQAFGWEPPQFWHIPLLTGKGGKKLSKRRSDTGMREILDRGTLPESVVNFVALLGWSPHLKPGQSEVLDLKQLEMLFSLEHLTKGNVQVDMDKLEFFDQIHFRRLAQLKPNEIAERCWVQLQRESPSVANALGHNRVTSSIFCALKTHVSSVHDFVVRVCTVMNEPRLTKPPASHQIEILRSALNKSNILNVVEEYSKREAYPALRYALLDSKPGVSIPEAVEVLGYREAVLRIKNAISRGLS